MTCPNNARRRGRSSSSGFTLVEILAVVLIIALLVSLLLPAINAAYKAGKRAAVTAEITQLQAALASFKVKYNDYPPSRIYLSEDGRFPIGTTDSVALYMGNTGTYDISIGQLAQRSVAALRKMFPQVTLSTTSVPVFDSTATNPTVWYDFNGNGKFDTNPYVLQGHECLVFFLGGIPLKTEVGYSMSGFGTNPTNPFTNSIVGNAMYGANRQAPFYEFVPGRLVIDTMNPSQNQGLAGIPGYYDSLGDVQSAPGATLTSDGTKTYSNATISYQNGKINYFAYFSTSGLGGSYDPNDVNFLATEDDGYLRFYGQKTTQNSANTAATNTISPGPNPYTTGTTYPTSGTISYQNSQSFQIISAGSDGLYGIGGQFSPPPAATVLPVDSTSTPLVTSVNASSSNPNVEAATVRTIRFRERDNLTNFTPGQLD